MSRLAEKIPPAGTHIDRNNSSSCMALYGDWTLIWTDMSKRANPHPEVSVCFVCRLERIAHTSVTNIDDCLVMRLSHPDTEVLAQHHINHTLTAASSCIHHHIFNFPADAELFR